MTTEALRELRDQLHAELSGSTAIDPERQGLLLGVKEEIDRLLTQDPDASQVAPADARDLQNRLQSAAVGFEGSHPKLAGTLEQALNVLSNMGL